MLGAALLNDGKYGCDVTGSVMRLTVLRSPPYAYHEPHPYGVKQRYRLDRSGHASVHGCHPPSSGVVAGSRRRGAGPAQLNQPPPLITMHAHAGERPPVASLLALSTEAMELTACKAAQDGNGIIARVADRYGQGSRGQIHFGGQDFPLTLAPFEVKTLRFTQVGGAWQAAACDMLEQPL